MKTFTAPVVSCLVFLSLACGGLGGGSSYGTVAFTTWEMGGDHWLHFKTASTVVYSWANMNGEPIQGTYTEYGDDVRLELEPSDAGNLRGYVLRRISKCAMGVTELRLEDEDWKDSSVGTLYEQTKPLCLDL